MAAELGTTTDPRALVPGSPDAIREEIGQCNRTSAAYLRTGDGLKHLDTADWQGEAAEAFHEAFDGHPTAWIKAGEAFLDAADALTRYVEMLEWAQGQAREAIALWQEAQAATEQARAEHETTRQRAEAAGQPAPEFVDPGAEKRRAAQDMLHRARMQLIEAGDHATTALEQARDRAPDKPGFWGRLGTGVVEFGTGIGEWVGDLGELVTNLDEIPANVSAAIAHPVEFAKGLVNWDQFHTNPARAAGHLLPDIALSFFAGAGVVKKGGDVLSGVTAGMKAAKTARVMDKATYNGKNVAEHVANKGADLGASGKGRKTTTVNVPDGATVRQIFEDLSHGGDVIPDSRYGGGSGTRVQMPNGSTVSIRSHSKTSPDPTVDLTAPDGTTLRIHTERWK